MPTILDTETRMALWQAEITDEQIAELEKALVSLAEGHAKMNAELALRIIKIVNDKEAQRVHSQYGGQK